MEGELVAQRYRVAARVGQGAMGVVWRAADELLRRDVALKQVSLPDGADGPMRERAHRRVFREARMIARLHHPHAVAVYDVLEHDGQPWLVMEYLPSRSLAEVLVAEGPLAPERVARIGRQVAEALVAAHEAGIVHRDVKPGNVLLAADGRVKVTDFGIARAVGDVTITSSGLVAGTPAYLAPEVARGAPADFRSDVYSLAATLYAALEGSPPFGTGENPLALLHRVATGEYDPPVRRGLITPLVERLLHPDPAHRPDMPQARDELARLVSADAGTEDGPVTPIMVRPDPVAAGAARGVAATSVTVPDASATTPVAPVGPPGDDTREEPSDGRSGRRRWPWVVVAGAAVVLVGAIVVAALLRTTGGPGASLSGGTAAPESSGETAPTTATGTGGTTAPVALSGSADDRARQQAVADYYALLPDRLDESWARLTPSFQSSTAGGFGSYRAFWGAMAEVTVTGLTPAGGSSVAAEVRYRYTDGRTSDERTVFGMVLQDGVWKIDSQRSGG